MTQPCLKAFKFRIYPSEVERTFFAKQFGCNRFAFNHMLEHNHTLYKEEKRHLGYFEMTALLPALKKQEETKWLAEVNAQSLQLAVKDLDMAFKRFFKKQSERPTFKSKHNRQCFKVAQRFKFENGKLWLPKLNTWIKVKVSREVIGKILYLHISKTVTGKYYVSFTVSGTNETFAPTGKSIGLDMGIKDAAILSDGTHYENIKAYSKLEKKLKYEQRQLSKKKKGSTSKERQRRKVAALHEKIKHLRHDHIEKLTTDIIKNNDKVFCEDLAVKNMVKNHKLAKSLSDVSFGAIGAKLEYKAEWHDRVFLKVDRFFPSSKTCSNCGWIKDDLTLKDRAWTCQGCDTHHDRDINAAKNILAEGLKKLKEMSVCGAHTDNKQKQGETSSLEEPRTPEKP